MGFQIDINLNRDSVSHIKGLHQNKKEPEKSQFSSDLNLAEVLGQVLTDFDYVRNDSNFWTRTHFVRDMGYEVGHSGGTSGIPRTCVDVVVEWRGTPSIVTAVFKE